MNEEVRILIQFILLNFLLPPVLTCLIETPIVYAVLKLKNILYIICVNVLTNLPFITVEMLLVNYVPDSKTIVLIYIAMMEAFVIPLSEALLFCLLKDEKKKCFMVSYLANASSFLAGLLLSAIIR